MGITAQGTPLGITAQSTPLGITIAPVPPFPNPLFAKSTMSKTLIILNPNADVGHAWRRIADLRPLAEELAGDTLQWAGTVYPTHATALAAQAAAQGFDRVIAVGGDGTVHEVVNGLMRIPAAQRPTLGVVPLGSGNDFAFGVGLPASPHEALRIALTAPPRPIDVIRVTDEHGREEFVDNTIGIGFDAIVTIRSHQLPVVRGFAMYLTAVLQTIALNHRPLHARLEADGRVWEDDLLMLVIGNGPREGGGFLTTPEARPDDGLLHYAAIGAVSRGAMLRLVPEVMQGTHANSPHVRMGTLRTLHLETDAPMQIHMDGEIFAGFDTHVRRISLEIVPAALPVAAPPPAETAS